MPRARAMRASIGRGSAARRAGTAAAAQRGTTSCPRSWSRICSGWGATRSAARTRRGWCGRRWRCAPMLRSGAAHASSASATACCRPRAIRPSPCSTMHTNSGSRRTSAGLSWCATQSRSRLSAEHWRSISVMQREFQEAGASAARSARGARSAAGGADRAQRLRARRHDAGRWLAAADARPAARARAVSGRRCSADRLAPGRRCGRANSSGCSIWAASASPIAPATSRRRSWRRCCSLLVFEQGSPRALCFPVAWRSARRWSIWRSRSAPAPRSPSIEPMAQLIEAAFDRGHRGRGWTRRRPAPRPGGSALAELAAAAARISDRLVLAALLAGGSGSARGGHMSALRYTVQHETLYSYGREVAHSHQLLHLTPRDSERQSCLEHSLRIDPPPAVQQRTPGCLRQSRDAHRARSRRTIGCGCAPIW